MDYTETFFKLYRKIFSEGLWKMPFELRLFLWILGNAVYNEDGIDYEDAKINRGQYLRSYRKLQEDLSYKDNRQIKVYPVTSIKRAVLKLTSMQLISVCDTKLGTLFTVLNYDKYQGNQSKNKEFFVERNDEIIEPGTASGTTCVQPVYNTKKDNKDKYIYDHKFKEFWSLYPRKVSKKRAKSVFLSIKPDDILFERIINAVKLQIQSDQWKKDDGQFIPHPATWLFQERWNDELACSIAQKPKVWNLDL